MFKRLSVLLIVALVFAGLASAYGATKVKTGFRLAGLPPFVVTAACGTATSVAITGTDGAASRTKRAIVQKWVINGSEVDVLIRVEHSHGQIWFDLVVDESVAVLRSNLNSLDLSTIAPGHPTPTKDALDSAAVTAAGG